MKTTDIPFNILVDIEFMLGDSYECQEYINPVLIKNGIKPVPNRGFFANAPEDIVILIYKELYLTDKMSAFFSMKDAIEQYPKQYKEYLGGK